MKKLVGWVYGLGLLAAPTAAFAEGVSAYSRGNAFIYFSAISAVLIFGVHDVFRKKWLTWACAIVIPAVMYSLLPEK
jgi:hypothetical protein